MGVEFIKWVALSILGSEEVGHLKHRFVVVQQFDGLVHEIRFAVQRFAKLRKTDPRSQFYRRWRRPEFWGAF